MERRDVQAGVVEIPIRGAGPANVLDSDAMARLEVALIAAERRGAAGAILHGPPGRFAAGADLATLERMGGAEAFEFGREGSRLFRRMERTSLWLAAAVDGHCIGGGFDLVLACDLVLATPRATFRHPGTRFGFPTTYGGNRRLPARVGTSPATAMLLQGRFVSAVEAHEAGLVTELVPADELRSRANERLARWIAAASPPVARSLQAVFRTSARLPLHTGVALEEAALRAASLAGDRSC